ncbi:hypothetical protein H0O03_02610 [Candidatus Micrarchaeota archaeon]|nr:hypothetical protein [Candidatus Micrarchaeota archaeon]
MERVEVRGQLFTIDLLTAAVIITLAVGVALYLDASTKTNYARVVESQMGTADALAEFLATNQSPLQPPACWCVTQTNLTDTVYENCSTAACFDSLPHPCKNVYSATRLSPYCVSGACDCNSTPCALEVRAC